MLMIAHGSSFLYCFGCPDVCGLVKVLMDLVFQIVAWFILITLWIFTSFCFLLSLIRDRGFSLFFFILHHQWVLYLICVDYFLFGRQYVNFVFSCLLIIFHNFSVVYESGNFLLSITFFFLTSFFYFFYVFRLKSFLQSFLFASWGILLPVSLLLSSFLFSICVCSSVKSL